MPLLPLGVKVEKKEERAKEVLRERLGCKLIEKLRGRLRDRREEKVNLLRFHRASLAGFRAGATNSDFAYLDSACVGFVSSGG